MAGVPVHVYWTDLDAAGVEAAAGLLGLLDDLERARADRFRFQRDRRRFIVRRGLLRILLADRLGSSPEAIRFARNTYGKPMLHESDVRFSASHSHGVALYAVTRGVELGCDIERRDERIDIDDTAHSLFAPGEIAMLKIAQPGQRRAEFFRCWTRKEAYVKALGLGLSCPLASFDTSSPNGQMAGWSIKSFEPQLHYDAAVAIHRDAVEFILCSR